MPRISKQQPLCSSYSFFASLPLFASLALSATCSTTVLCILPLGIVPVALPLAVLQAPSAVLALPLAKIAAMCSVTNMDSLGSGSGTLASLVGTCVDGITTFSVVVFLSEINPMNTIYLI